MGRPRKTELRDDQTEREISDRDDRDGERNDFENEMFVDAIESPFHIPRDEWPDGLAFRWLSYEVTGAPDNRNWSIKTSAGWQPVRRGKYPKIDRRFPSIDMPGRGDTTGGVITFGSLCLAERDIRLSIRDKKRQEHDTANQGRTIETYVEGGNANFPRFNQSSQVQYERGVRPAAFKE